MKLSRIHVSSPAFLGLEREHVLECLDSGWLSQGIFVKQCERELAELSGTTHAVVCSSGTAALHLGVLALDLMPGDGVLVPAMTYVATANAVRYAGGVPVFCDVDERTWCIDPADAFLKARRHVAGGGRIVGSIPVHLYGVKAPVDELRDFGWVLEDAAQAIGCDFEGCTATFSFYASKILVAGEGGALVTDDAALATRTRLFRGQGAPIPGRYRHDVVGYNYRLTDLQAAVLLGQLETYDEHARRRLGLAQRYEARLAPSQYITLQERPQGAANWVCAVLLNYGVAADKTAVHLDCHGVETRPFFLPLPSLLPYREPRVEEDYPVSVNFARQGLVLPLHSGMRTRDVDRVCDLLLESLR